ncbi:MAG: hypothetical protein U0441_32555 [Polyangiaceae bacterium]
MASMALPALVSSFAILCSACGESAPVTYVGAPKGNDLAFGIVSGEGAVVAYVCGGSSTYATHSRWFTGPLDADGKFSAEADGWTLSGTIGAADSDSVTATLVAPDMTSSDLSASRGLAGSTDGLYDVEDSGCRTGVVTWTDPVGQPQLQGTWCDDKDEFAQVTPVLPITVSDKGLHVVVNLAPFGLPKRDLYVEQVPTPVAKK